MATKWVVRNGLDTKSKSGVLILILMDWENFTGNLLGNIFMQI